MNVICIYKCIRSSNYVYHHAVAGIRKENYCIWLRVNTEGELVE